jgi:hypothetical protein
LHSPCESEAVPLENSSQIKKVWRAPAQVPRSSRV